jgi:hypothetical protein
MYGLKRVEYDEIGNVRAVSFHEGISGTEIRRVLEALGVLKADLYAGGQRAATAKEVKDGRIMIKTANFDELHSPLTDNDPPREPGIYK